MKMLNFRWTLAICISLGSFANGFDNIDELLTKSEVFRQFEKRLTDLEERDSVQQRLILELTNELTEQKQENVVLRETVAELKSKIDYQNTTQNTLSQDSSSRVSVMEKSEKTKARQMSGPEDVKPRLRNGSRSIIGKRQQANQATVAFSAGLSHIIAHAGADQNIVFDKVTTNIANGYNANHGVFIAPVAGTYVFHSSILAGRDREVWCRFVVNGVHGASMNARGESGRFDQSSNMIIVQLNQGDDVSVQNMSPDDAIHGDADLYTTFSGFLLQGEGELNIVG